VRLEERHGLAVSYSAVRRLVQRLEPPPPPETFVRVEVPPGKFLREDEGELTRGRTTESPLSPTRNGTAPGIAA